MSKLVLYFPLFLMATNVHSTTYTPNWASLDTRPLPVWYDEAKLGIFINWGIYSVPSYGNEWFWWNWQGAKNQKIVDFMERNYKPGFTYPDFATDFTAEFFDPVEWTDIFVASRAKYIVFDCKHHEGYTLWPSNVSFNWNSMDVGPKRDLVGDLARSIRSLSSNKIHFGIYHSLFEWFNPVYLQDKAAGFKTQNFVKDKTLPELYEIVNNYQPDVIWSDGDWEASSTYWNSTGFLAWLYNESPVKDTVVVNDRWGRDSTCRHGGFYTCSDRYNPKKLQNHKWENAMTIDKSSWGFRRDATLSDYLTVHDLITLLAETVSCGGNLLVNIAPTKDGRITPIYEEKLRQLGSWLDVNSDAIFGTRPWTHQNDSDTAYVWYTSKSSTVYAIVLQWPDDHLLLGSVKPSVTSSVRLLGTSQYMPFTMSKTGGMDITVPAVPVNKLPCKWAWVFQLEGVTPH